ncbi:ComEC/Rec2 family competence protein [Aureimonas ureilytica]|uniref:hypothetical protein n=1 Tax=Aureimonas ureilytica TaxID=401562 RepID=UPI00036C9466|nr:hypothetical protein [Aureimonas ureilytica]
MPAYLTFFPLGNADTTLIRLANDDLVLLDYANMRNAADAADKRIDLPSTLREELADAGRASFRAVAFTHLDDDHIKGASDFFWFDHSTARQSANRVKIDDLWVPAAAITEVGVDGDAWCIRQEARYRLKQGYGVKIFSRPGNLAAFLAANGLSVESRRHCIVNAGELVPGFSVNNPESAEFFVHSPFAWRTNGGLEDRNENSIVVQMTARDLGIDSYALLGADIDHETLSQIVKTTRQHGNEHRLHWDVLKLFHHCSYKSLSPDKGIDKTEPVEDVRWLFEDLAREKEIIVSPSWPIPVKGSADDLDPQPPHRQAANYYKEIIKDSSGQFKVTMETPSEAKPKPIKLKMSLAGVGVVSTVVPSVAGAVSSSSTRAG